MCSSRSTALVGSAVLLQRHCELHDLHAQRRSHSIVAIYSGDPKFTGSTSSTLSQTVGTAPLTITADSGGKTFGTVWRALAARTSRIADW